MKLFCHGAVLSWSCFVMELFCSGTFLLCVEQCKLHLLSRSHGLQLGAPQQANIERQATRDQGCRVEPKPCERVTVHFVTVTWAAAGCAALRSHHATSSEGLELEDISILRLFLYQRQNA